jgi:hypothetical protein
MGLPALTRRRDPDASQESWRVFYGDVHVGTIGMRSGIPVHADQWGWRCGFYPGLLPGQHRAGSAASFELVRAAFEQAWQRLHPNIPEGAFAEYRQDVAWTKWKRAMWDSGCRLPTQEPTGRSRCFCGAEIDIAKTVRHARGVTLMPRNPLDLPPEVARRFVEDMLAFFAETNSIKRDEIAARQMHVLRQYQGPREKKLRVIDVIEMFKRMRDQV